MIYSDYSKASPGGVGDGGWMLLAIGLICFRYDVEFFGMKHIRKRACV